VSRNVPAMCAAYSNPTEKARYRPFQLCPLIATKFGKSGLLPDDCAKTVLRDDRIHVESNTRRAVRCVRGEFRVTTISSAHRAAVGR